MRPSVACPHGTNCHLWGVTPWVLLITNLPEKPECTTYRSPHQGNYWQAQSWQSGTTSGPPDGDLKRVHLWHTEGMDPGGIEPPGPQGVA